MPLLTEEQWDKYIEEARERLHASPDESDENLKREIIFAHNELQSWCGSFGLDNERGRGLVLEYVRFLYNGQGEYFSTAYRQSITSFSWDLYKPEGSDA